jgi:hypothetical protein
VEQVMDNPLELVEPNITAKSFTRYIVESRYPMIHPNNPGTALEFLAVSNALGGEVGELQNIVKKIIREGVFYSDTELHQAFVLEAGDSLHYLLSLIQMAGYNVEHIMACNVTKLNERKKAHEEVQTGVFTTAPSESRT